MKEKPKQMQESLNNIQEKKLQEEIENLEKFEKVSQSKVYENTNERRYTNSNK